MSLDPVGTLRTAQRLAAEGRSDQAIGLISPWLGRLGGFSELHAFQLDLFLKAGRRVEAEAAFDGWLARFGGQVEALDALGFYARRLDRHELAAELYAAAVAAAPDDAQLWYNLAAGRRSLGQLEEAMAACGRALALDRGLMQAVLLRSELVRASPEANHVDDLRARLAASREPRVEIFCGYALGKELHDLGRFDEAFNAFALGARARRRLLAYDVAQDEAKMGRIQEVYGSACATAASAQAWSGRHIFIIGLPRSGTTLTERILAALPDVRSNGETDNFSTALVTSAPAGPQDIFDRCARAPAEEVARRYEALAGGRGPQARVIEKLPLNYLYVGAIAAALPDAAIIWVRRHPLDSCFAMFRTLFGEGYPFSYNLGDLARYYAAYDRLMRHWETVLPGRLIAVDYEQLVADPAGEGARVAQACGLAWEEGAVDLSRNRSASLTASASQVRGEIYKSSAGLWLRYADHLQPLAAQLADLGVPVP